MGRGRLAIYPADKGGVLAASLDRLDVDKYYQIIYPILDVRVVTFDEGLLVVGYQIVAEGGAEVVREYRQAWYCVPVAKHQ